MDVKNIKQEPNTDNDRKRPFSEISAASEKVNDQIDVAILNTVKRENDVEEVQQPKRQKFMSPASKIIDESCFKIVIIKHQKRLRKLLIFTSSAQTHCYEYNYNSKEDVFYHRCHSSAYAFKAILELNENRNDCLQYDNKQHVCCSLPYDPSKYNETKVIKKPDYKIMENGGTKFKRMLIIFNPNGRSQCYEYYWRTNIKKFECCGCAAKKKRILAEVCHEDTENEYIRLLGVDHVCEIRKYNPERYHESNQIVSSSDYKIRTKIKNGKERKTLIIFDGNDRKMCYTYFFLTRDNAFYCSSCEYHHKQVSAKFWQDEDGEDYVVLSNVKHVCSPKEYIPEDNEIILRPPAIKFMEANERFKSKLFIFDSKNKKRCYIFTQYKDSRRYQCLGCFNLTKGIILTERKNIVSVYLCNDDDGDSNYGEYYVKTMKNQKHICKPQKYEPEKYESKVLKPKDDYILFRKNETDSLSLAVYDLNDKSLCFAYSNYKLGREFRCSKTGCSITAEINQDSTGNEYIKTNYKNHLCDPIEISSIIKPDTEILKKSGLAVKKKKPKIDERRIVRLPDFELQANVNGVPERKLIIFKKDVKELCYEYMFADNHFECKKCRITAKLHVDSESDEKYVIVSNSKHSCEPVKYEAEKKKTFEPSNFMIFNQDDDSKLTKLVIFTSAAKELCYEYSYIQGNKSFRCTACFSLKVSVSARLEKNADGEEYIQLFKNDHICTPKIFVLEEFQPKIVPESDFIICSNVNGKENSRLILFDSEKESFCYEYLLKKNLFTCNGCLSKKKYTVTAKLREKENGERYLELSSSEHICKSAEYDPENYKVKETAKLCGKKGGENNLELPVEKRICKSTNGKKPVFGNFVVQRNSAGDPDSRLIVFDENDKTHGYQYFFYKSKNAFSCCECHYKKKKLVTAKLMMDEEGKQYLEYGKIDHVCSIQNLKEKKSIFDDFKFEENGNALITNDSTQTGRFYKFKFDDKLGAFCCNGCKEKKKYITATVCNGNDQKEFILLNYAHCCISLSKPSRNFAKIGRITFLSPVSK